MIHWCFIDIAWQNFKQVGIEEERNVCLKKPGFELNMCTNYNILVLQYEEKKSECKNIHQKCDIFKQNKQWYC